MKDVAFFCMMYRRQIDLNVTVCICVINDFLLRNNTGSPPCTLNNRVAAGPAWSSSWSSSWSQHNTPHHLTDLSRPLIHPHLQQRQVRVQVCEAVQNHRAAVLDHLQPHPVPYVPHPPRRVKHLEQLSRIDAVRLGLHPREIDHGCPRCRPSSHSDGGDIFTVFPRCFETKASLLLLLLREAPRLCWIITAVFRSIMTQRGAFLNPALWLVLPSGPSEIPETKDVTVD